MWVKWKLIAVSFEIVLISALDRCTVCDECTKAWKSFWPHMKELLGDVGQMKARFILFGNNVHQDAK
jgi:hypothetical protein